MCNRVCVVVGGVLLAGLAMTQQKPRLNPVIDLLAEHKPVFGLYAPANPRGGRGGRGGGRGAGGAGGGAVGTPDTTPPPPRKTAAELAADAVAYKGADLIFDGTMEGGARFDTSLAAFSQFAQGMLAAGYVQKSLARLSHPLFVKMTEIHGNDQAESQIAKQLNAGVSGVVFVSVESADEVKRGLAAMRFKSNGGTRPDDVAGAPAMWGLSEKDYKAKADLWPLNPNGELVNWTIVETQKGLDNVREIAAVKGIGALFPGAGTLGGLFTTTDSTGRRVRDNEKWEAAIQKVLAACKEFNVPCGFPIGDPATMELRMKQGFSVFIINWNQNGFAAVEVGRKASGR
ncbi:MAG TPA: aldolase/citrate lyase family protein [Gemmatimonadaceae bacterium]|nr:aldolase/citrate lyase family protein [Gemmatimonadaceae bacterium]